MSGVISAALRELVAAGVKGDALVRAVERIEEAAAKHRRASGAERTAKWRENQRLGDVTASQTSHVTPAAEPPSKVPPITPLNTPPGSEPKGSAPDGAPAEQVDVVGEDPKARLFRLGKTALVSFGITERRTGSLIGQWLKSRNDPAGLLAAIQFARDQNVAEPVAYISTLMRGKGQPNGHAKQGLGELALELADQLRERERAAGIGRPPAA